MTSRFTRHSSNARETTTKIDQWGRDAQALDPHDREDIDESPDWPANTPRRAVPPSPSMRR
jgi:hypothetical protein